MPETRLRYMPALDGLRAAAVTAVLLYHANVTWASGGFLGVDAFFVLSGFLITSLLRDEPISAAFLALSIGATLAVGAILVFIAGRLYHREALLG